MNYERILDLFGKLSGLPEELVRVQGFLCDMSAQNILARLRCPAEQCGGKAELAAAALAYYRYVLWTMTDGGAEGIKVGDVSVRNGKERLLHAERLFNEALDELRGCIGDDSFVFERI